MRTGVLARKRTRALFAVVVLSVVFGAGALVAASFVRSPAQLAADARPPAAGPVTALVEQRVLSATVLLRGNVGPERLVRLTAPRAGDSGARPVVTRLPLAVGDSVSAGAVVAEIAGRPIIALPGASPAYRDLVPGAEGADVAQLQEALRALGFGTGKDRAGKYGSGTKAAVKQLYQGRGYQTRNTGTDDDRQLLQAERAVRDARQAVSTAAEPERAAAQQRLVDATADYDDLVARTGAVVPVGEVAFVPDLPARVQQVKAAVGADVTGDFLSLSSGALSVRATLNPQQAQQVRVGMQARLDSEVTAVSAAGRVTSIGPAAAPAEGEAAPSPTVEAFVHPDQPLPDTLVGQDVRVTVVAASTAGEVLVVPLAAVTARADGQAEVVVISEGRESRVVVMPGVSGGGFVEVRPVAAGLSKGDRVVVGR